MQLYQMIETGKSLPMGLDKIKIDKFEFITWYTIGAHCSVQENAATSTMVLN